MSRPRKSPTQTTTKLKKKSVVKKRSLPTRTAKKVRRVTSRTLSVSEKRSVLSSKSRIKTYSSTPKTRGRSLYGKKGTVHSSPSVQTIKDGFKMTSRIKKRIGIFLLTIGIILLAGPKILSTVFPEPAISHEPIMADSSFVSTNQKEEFPTQIIIPSVKIDLPITLAKINRGYWETSETTASFGQGSAPPGQKNNTVIFAHAKEHLFLPLKEVNVGDNIYLFTSNRYFSYTVDSITEVKPTDVYVVKKTDDERLTLFTCSGFLDNKRLVVIAKPVVETHEKAPQ